MSAEYPPIFDKLLTYGEASADEIPDYLALGFSDADVEGLIRLATDQHLLTLDDEDADEVWAPIHAWRTLQQLKAEAALEPLMQLFDLHETAEYDSITEWIREELPDFYVSFGAAAIPALRHYVEDTSHKNPYAVANATDPLVKIADQDTSVRDEVLAIIVQRLEQFSKNDTTLNGFLIDNLIDLKAFDQMPLIERAFAAKRVDENLIDLEDVQVAMGLKAERDNPRESQFTFPTLEKPAALPPSTKKLEKAKKAKRKQANKSRKINRKKKK